MKTIRFCYIVFAILAMSSCRKPCHEHCEILSESYVHKYGFEVEENDWNSRGQNGQVISTLANGVNVSANYTQGFLDGNTAYTFPHTNTIERVEVYANGVLIEKTFNNRLGAPIEKIQFHSSRERTVTKWYENGSPESIESYNANNLVDGEYFSPNHQLEARVSDGEGIRMVRDASGKLLATATIAHGTTISQTTFHPNGSPMAIIPFNSDGKIDGQRKTFLATGEPDTIEEWKNGQRIGMTTLFQYGEKYAEVPYNGEKDGLERRFCDGRTIEEITWVKGQKHGPAFTFVGNTTKTDWYFKDKLVLKTTFDQMSTVAK